MALAAIHPVIKGTGQRHSPQDPPKGLRIKLRVPWAYRPVILIQHPHQIGAERRGIAGRASFVWPQLHASRGNFQKGIVNRITRTEVRLWHVQVKRRQIAALAICIVLRLGHDTPPVGSKLHVRVILFQTQAKVN
jgi:hypothetical protein